jgi:anti-sigma factor RsiW
MSCSPFDLKDYFLKELPPTEGRQVEAHIRTCLPCREELERLHLTEAALFSLRDEEIPQRIAFVSDKIFEPSPLGRWWNRLAPNIAFAAAAVALALAIRPAPSERQIQARVDAAVTKAVTAQTEQIREMANRLQLAADEFELSQKRAGMMRRAMYSLPPGPEERVQ